MHDLVASCAAGKVDDKVVLDINDEEDKEGQADMPVAYMPRLEQVTLLQLDGRLAPEQFGECLDKAIGGCKIVYEIQKQALMQKYFGNETELKEEVQ
jgi:exosome complex component RRP41